MQYADKEHPRNSMVKLGVFTIDQYHRSQSGSLAWLRRGRIDYRLLRPAASPAPNQVAVFEAIMQQIQLSGGVFRTTSPHRFRELDAAVAPILLRHFTPQQELRIADWAASDCGASAAWHQNLSRMFPRFCLTASDLNLYLIEMEVAGQGSYVFEQHGGVLQFIAPPFVIRLHPPEPRLLVINRLLARRALARLRRLRHTRNIDPTNIEFPPGSEELRRDRLTFRKVPLIHPSAAALARESPSFRIEQHSIFEPAPTPSHVIRTMNILNRVYFDSPTLERGVKSVWRSLHPGGLWIVGRTIQESPPVHHVSVLRKITNGFELVERHKQASEIEDLALALKC